LLNNPVRQAKPEGRSRVLETPRSHRGQPVVCLAYTVAVRIQSTYHFLLKYPCSNGHATSLFGAQQSLSKTIKWLSLHHKSGKPKSKVRIGAIGDMKTIHGPNMWSTREGTWFCMYILHAGRISMADFKSKGCVLQKEAKKRRGVPCSVQALSHHSNFLITWAGWA